MYVSAAKLNYVINRHTHKLISNLCLNVPVGQYDLLLYDVDSNQSIDVIPVILGAVLEVDAWGSSRKELDQGHEVC